MKCTICGNNFPEARSDAGYTVCIPCSEEHTPKKHGMTFSDSDGNIQTLPVNGVGRGYAVFADSEITPPETQEL